MHIMAFYAEIYEKLPKNLLRSHFLPEKLINYGATDDQIFTKIFLVVNYYPMGLSFKFCKVPCTHACTRAITAQRVNVARREKLFLFSLLSLQKSTLTPKNLGFDVSAG